VAADLSEVSAEAVDQGRRIAQRWGVPLSVCYVSKRARTASEPRTPATGWSAVRDKLEQAQLADWLVCVLGVAHTDVRDVVTEPGPAHEAVLAAASRVNPSLIVLGTRWTEPDARPTAPVPVELLRMAPADLLFARPARAGAVLAVDLDADAPAVLATAADHARQRGRDIARLTRTLAGTDSALAGAMIVDAARSLPADLVVLGPGRAQPGSPFPAVIAQQLLRTECCSVLLLARLSPEVVSATSAANLP
jgi:nucleotide-binding universal stress UspA family protein